MPLNDLEKTVASLNARYRHHSATSVLAHALRDPEAGDLALASSFGAESVVLLHMVSVAKRDTPVIFLDTELLFAETLVYQQEVSERLGLTDVRSELENGYLDWEIFSDGRDSSGIAVEAPSGSPVREPHRFGAGHLASRSNDQGLPGRAAGRPSWYDSVAWRLEPGLPSAESWERSRYPADEAHSSIGPAPLGSVLAAAG